MCYINLFIYSINCLVYNVIVNNKVLIRTNYCKSYILSRTFSVNNLTKVKSVVQIN